MAILELETQNYYKVEFDECMIKGLSAYVTYSTYKTTEDREKEKARRPLLTAFLNAVQQRLFTLDSEINEAVQTLGLTPADVTDGDGYIHADYPELRAKQDEILALSSVQQDVFGRFYLYGDGEVEDYNPTVSKDILEGYGFDETWLTDPVRLSMKAQIYCGEYGDEPITAEFYYNRLKERMSDQIEDC
jgi:hypothetical protein